MLDTKVGSNKYYAIAEVEYFSLHFQRIFVEKNE
jgi:hypothetical protein